MSNKYCNHLYFNSLFIKKFLLLLFCFNSALLFTYAEAQSFYLTYRGSRQPIVTLGTTQIISTADLYNRRLILRSDRYRMLLERGRTRVGRGRAISFKSRKGIYRVSVQSDPAVQFQLSNHHESTIPTTSFTHNPPAPAPTPKSVSSSYTAPPSSNITAVPFPSTLKQRWESNMTRFGSTHCDSAKIADLSTWEGSIWYYDGILVFHNMAEYTGQSSWYNCANYVKDVYRKYVLVNGGKIGGWRLFPHGLTEDYFRTGESASKDAVVAMAANSPFSSAAGGVDPELSRETAYLISTFVEARKVGYQGTLPLSKAVDYALQHLDDWVSERTPYVKPFMVGLTMESLILYADFSGDTRVLPAVSRAADWLWNRHWVGSQKLFPYISCKNTNSTAECTSPDQDSSGDLNMLIVPAYGWLYKKTKEARFAQRGDLIFEGGVDAAWLGGGKQFSQSYRRSFDYISWRAG